MTDLDKLKGLLDDRKIPYGMTTFSHPAGRGTVIILSGEDSCEDQIEFYFDGKGRCEEMGLIEGQEST